MAYVIGIDIGGTFTDFLTIDESTHRQLAHKSSSTPDDPSTAVINGLSEIADELDLSIANFVGQIRLIVHGTTVATNAVLTGRGARTGLLTTSGVRDILEMRRGVRSREHLYDNKYVPPEPLVRRTLRKPVDERVTIDGTVLTELSDAAASEAVQNMVDEDVEALAICFMHSYANPVNEEKVLEAARELAGDRFVSASFEVLPQVRLYERVSTTVMNAYVGPVVQRYMHRLSERLAENGFSGALLIMQSNGGVASVDVVEKVPASTVLSGPAGGPVAALRAARAENEDACVLVEMGGTSFDASLVKDGRAQTTRDGEIGGQSLSLPMTEIHTIGAGGGSIAWVDSGGLLQVGPQSAGADPGPVAYGLGGVEPTVTDANVALGYIDPNYFLGGRMPLRKDLAEEIINAKIAEPLGVSTTEAAAGILEVITMKMASETKDITVRRGFDPREFQLVVGGGAGPLHAAAIARELDINQIIVPRRSAVLCASGMLQADLRHDYAQNVARIWDAKEGPEIATVARKLSAEGESVLDQEGVPEPDRESVIALDMRYAGQHYEISVEIPLEALKAGAEAENAVADAFHERHRQLYGYSQKHSQIHVVTLRVAAIGHREQAFTLSDDSIPTEPGIARKGQRMAWLNPVDEWQSVDVFDGRLLAVEELVNGPALVDTATTTIWIPRDFRLKTNQTGDFVIRPTDTKAGIAQ